MLRKLKLNEIEAASNLAYSLSINPSTNSYPLRNSQKEFLERYKLSIEYPDDELLGYFKNKELIAVIFLNVEKKNLYLQTNGIFIKNDIEIVMSKFIDYLHENYNSYKIYIGYPEENKVAINYLLNHGFKIIESSIDLRLEKQDFIPSNLQNLIVKIDNINYPEFAKYHDSKANDMYWNGKRIKEDFNNWILYSYWSGSQIKASIAARRVNSMLEIFALFIDNEIANKCVEEDLITATLKEGFDNNNIKNVVFFIDTDDNNALAYSKNLGFKVYSNYRCLSIKL